MSTITRTMRYRCMKPACRKAFEAADKVILDRAEKTSVKAGK